MHKTSVSSNNSNSAKLQLATEQLLFYTAGIIFAIFLRASVSLHGYSGEGKPPMYGDYEAQRHWQEITVNLPIRDWYRNTSDNDLMYWGLDYPPLTAYHSLLLGLAARTINSTYVELHRSRGLTTSEHKYFMRWTVLLADILIYIPAIIMVIRSISKFLPKKPNAKVELLPMFATTILALIYPGQILIDNGHFQYNNLSLGLMLFAVTAIILDHTIFAAIFFSLSLNYKQMELYHALPFFCYLLRNCFTGKQQSFMQGLLNLVKLGLVVIATFALVWSPWIFSVESFLAVIKRIFPVARGVFEDKVSNFWCLFNVIIKIKEKYSNEFMVVVCMLTTVLTALPSSLHLFVRPSKINFLYALVNVSSAFFLFSFQVHEKSILLVAISALLLTPIEPIASQWFAMISVFSMFPLIEKDQLTVAFISTMVIYGCTLYIIRNIQSVKHQAQETTGFENFIKSVFGCSILIAIFLVFCYIYVLPPKNLPHLFSLAIAAYCCVHFLAFLLYFNYKQIISNKSYIK